MKLWQKISILCGLIVALTISACTYIQLVETYNHQFEAISLQTQRKQQNLVHNFENMLRYYQAEDGNDASGKALYHYCFTRLADSKCALMIDGELIWNNLTPEAEKLVLAQKFEDEDGTYGMVGARSGNLILYGVEEGISTRTGIQNYRIFVYEDISGVKDSIRQMARKFILVALGCLAVSLALIIGVVSWTMKPLSALNKATAQIADGDYSQRAAVRSRDEVGSLARNFNRMAASVEGHVAELTETAQRQRLFIGAVTHEFKTPLTSILLNTDSLQNTYMTEDEQFAAFSAITAQGKWLERLVQKLLKLLTLNREVTLEPISVPELLERVQTSTAEVMEQRGVKLDIQCSTATLTGDMDLLQSALVNLVDNAGKASQPGQTVWLTAADRLLEVADHGAGIPAEALSHITEPFYMADPSRNKAQGGVGLGLALVQEIVTVHNARLEVESTSGVGTVMRIRF